MVDLCGASFPSFAEWQGSDVNKATTSLPRPISSPTLPNDDVRLIKDTTSNGKSSSNTNGVNDNDIMVVEQNLGESIEKELSNNLMNGSSNFDNLPAVPHQLFESHLLEDVDPITPTRIIKTRKSLSRAEKLAILEKIVALQDTLSQREIATRLCLSRSTVQRLTKEEVKIREESTTVALSRKRKRTGKNVEVESALLRWFNCMSSRGMRLNGPVLKQTGLEMAHALGFTDFVATDGWFARFKSRYQLQYRGILNQKASTDSLSASEWKLLVLPTILETYSADDVFNADETTLYYRATPDGSFTFNYQDMLSCKEASERITVLCCTNLSGSNKRKLLVVGESPKPRCLEGISMRSLPVQYKSHPKAWVTSLIFNEWLLEWNEELKQAKRKVVLFVSSCAVHARIDFLSHVRLEFIPHNVTCNTQPMSLGIIENLKMHYRCKLVTFVKRAMEASVLSPQSTIEAITSKINLLQAVEFLSDSWQSVSCATIEHCFWRAGFTNGFLNPPELDADVQAILGRVANSGDYLGVDNKVPCFDDNDRSLVEELCEDVLHHRNIARPEMDQPLINTGGVGVGVYKKTGTQANKGGAANGGEYLKLGFSRE